MARIASTALSSFVLAALAAAPAAAQSAFDFQSPSFGGRNTAKHQTQKEAAERHRPSGGDSGEQTQAERLNDRIRRRAEREIAEQVISGDEDDPFGGLGEFDTRTQGDTGIIEIPGSGGSILEIEVPAETDFWDNLTSDDGDGTANNGN